MTNELLDLAKRVVESRKFPANYKSVQTDMVLVSAWDLYDLHRHLAEEGKVLPNWRPNERKTNIELVGT